MKSKLLVFNLIIYCYSCVYAQTSDSLILNAAFDELVVTATKTETSVNNLPLPLTVITAEQIALAGNLRLGDLLAEQTGLAIDYQHGQGLQMQGFGADYTLILIDGEPVIGRVAGTLELSRLTVANVERIEIVKGAASSLYGSEALAGVVNIITKRPKRNQLNFSARYGSNNTLDLGAQVAFVRKKFSANIFINRLSSSGYDHSPQSYGQTVEPFANYTAQLKLGYRFGARGHLQTSLRYFDEQQQAHYDVGSAQPSYLAGRGYVRDASANTTFSWDWSRRWHSQARYYYARYATASQLRYVQGGGLYDDSFFDQSFARYELQNNYKYNDNQIFIFGLGHLRETVMATRYTDKKYLLSYYVFAQHEAKISDKLNAILGARFDYHLVYGSQISPKIAIGYRPTPKIQLQAGAGRGFKAPDFRQLYLNFNNSVAGYSVYGSEELPQALQQLQAAQQLAEIFIDTASIGQLQAENSWSYNLGANYQPTQNISLKINLFRNDVRHLIETRAAAVQRNAQTIYTYINLNNIYTQGLEFNADASLFKDFRISAGYQLLYAKDKTVLQQLRDGLIFSRDPVTFETSRLSPQDYGGLMNRSRHSFNFKLAYQPKTRIAASFRLHYRGRYGFADYNANAILDQPNEYVKGYFLCHLAASYSLPKPNIRLQVGIDNLLNYRNAEQIPNIAGRLFWLSLQYQIQ